MRIINMNQATGEQIIQAARILTDSIPIGWATLEEALGEIEERLIPGNTLLAAVENGVVLGWGGILAPVYNGNVFELHPLAVRSDRRNEGIGRAVVSALEDKARRQGGLTIHLGADDEKDGGETSLANCDLYDDLPGKLNDFTPGTHQSGFYLKMGYKIIGVMPDANGRGKPDIFFGKRL
ncbi:MAG: GNAT family N-acetyltransferase [Eubacteriales bacterium]|jgi:aminoglycoside 6'-N-acetyltransferase I|nr:GNAT family N-acetyltransferase [Eubacteriales bacterium]